MDIKEELATEALRIVNGSRRSAYGTPERNFERIATLWSAYLTLRQEAAVANGSEWSLEPRDVAAMMRLMKEARVIETPDHRDSFLDIVGYALCGAEVSGVGTLVAEVRSALRAEEDQMKKYEVVTAEYAGEPLHLLAKTGDEVCASFFNDGTARWVDVIDTDGEPGRRLFTSNGSSVGYYNDEWILAVRRERKPTTGSDTPAAQSWTDPEHEDGA